MQQDLEDLAQEAGSNAFSEFMYQETLRCLSYEDALRVPAAGGISIKGASRRCLGGLGAPKISGGRRGYIIFISFLTTVYSRNKIKWSLSKSRRGDGIYVKKTVSSLSPYI